MLPLSLYIHLPWCIKKCPYCDFNSHQAKNGVEEELQLNYIEHLLLDLHQSISSHTQIDRLHSIFIGGGTPSLFSAQNIELLLNKINDLITIPDGTEITLEANPGTFEQQKFKDFKQAGINRLSIGVQSFDNNSLKLLGRIHDGLQAQKAITAAHDIGFNFNIDLMHCLPQQTTELALQDLALAMQYQPNHISWYQLTIEPNTQFAKHHPELPIPNIQDDIYEQGLNMLTTHHYLQYEISAFARKDTSSLNYQSIHNLNYWRYGDYIGIGAGAHSKLTTAAGTTRTWKQKSPIRYLDLDTPKISGSSILKPEEVLLEYMMNKLRILEPITEQELFYHTKFKFSDIISQINQAQNNGWMNFQHNILIITELGRQFLNSLILLFA